MSLFFFYCKSSKFSILYLEHISILTGHILSAQQPHVASGCSISIVLEHSLFSLIHPYSNLLFTHCLQKAMGPYQNTRDNSLYLDSYVVLSRTNVHNLLNHFPMHRYLFPSPPFQIRLQGQSFFKKPMCTCVYFQSISSR